MFEKCFKHNTNIDLELYISELSQQWTNYWQNSDSHSNNSQATQQEGESKESFHLDASNALIRAWLVESWQSSVRMC